MNELIKGGQGRSDKATADSVAIIGYCLVMAVVVLIMAVVTT